MQFNIKILESNSEIIQNILQAMKAHLDKHMPKVISSIQNKLQPILADAMRQEPEYSSLISGLLKADLGLPDTTIVDGVINIISNSIEIEKKPIVIGKSNIKGGFIVKIIKIENLGGALNSNLATIKTDKIDIPWLEWLCFRGNDVLVKDYKVQYGPSQYSRSGMAIMRSSQNSVWRVPPQFIGTEESNWITRAIDRIENNIYDLFIKTVEAEL